MAFAFHTQRKEDTGSSTYDKALLEEYKSQLRGAQDYDKVNQQADISADVNAAATVEKMLPHMQRNPTLLQNVTTHPDWVNSTYPALRRQGKGYLFSQNSDGSWRMNYESPEKKKSQTFDDFLITRAQQMFPAPGPDDTFEPGVNPTNVTGKILQRQADWISGQKAKAGVIGAQQKADIPTVQEELIMYKDMKEQEPIARQNVLRRPDISSISSRYNALSAAEQQKIDQEADMPYAKILEGLTQEELDRLIGGLARTRNKARYIAADQSKVSYQ
jgi:hypothetical protein